MSAHEIESKVQELKQPQALIDEATAEAEAIKAHMGDSEELRAREYKVTRKAACKRPTPTTRGGR